MKFNNKSTTQCMSNINILHKLHIYHTPSFFYKKIVNRFVKF